MDPLLVYLPGSVPHRLGGRMAKFRLHSRLCSYGRPNGVRRLDIDTDYNAFPVWTWFMLPAVRGRPPREVCGCASPAYLGISSELAADLQAWADWRDQHQHAAWRGPGSKAKPSTDEDWNRWRADGRLLADRLARETGAEVVYMWPSEGRDPQCPNCGGSWPPWVRG